ncbi:MAG: hypothetical protein BMS9Abin13_127 [Patescibacteria group bacterium]|nr:MAG: hypothetical protein BMS9Abin13_127 [Patescibacteria group bacterium]
MLFFRADDTEHDEVFMNTVAQKLYEVDNFQPFVNECLGILNGVPLLDQFKRQNIQKIIFQPLLVCGGLARIKEGGCELVMYLDTRAANYDEHAFTLGHEIGHTFHPLPDGENLDSLRMHAQGLPAVHEEEDLIDRIVERNESFADAFAEAWLKQDKNKDSAEMFISACHPGEEQVFFVLLK